MSRALPVEPGRLEVEAGNVLLGGRHGIGIGCPVPSCPIDLTDLHNRSKLVLLPRIDLSPLQRLAQGLRSAPRLAVDAIVRGEEPPGQPLHEHGPGEALLEQEAVVAERLVDLLEPGRHLRVPRDPLQLPGQRFGGDRGVPALLEQPRQLQVPSDPCPVDVIRQNGRAGILGSLDVTEVRFANRTLRRDAILERGTVRGEERQASRNGGPGQNRCDCQTSCSRHDRLLRPGNRDETAGRRRAHEPAMAREQAAFRWKRGGRP